MARLLRFGADERAESDCGLTAAMSAASGGQTGPVLMLLGLAAARRRHEAAPHEAGPIRSYSGDFAKILSALK